MKEYAIPVSVFIGYTGENEDELLEALGADGNPALYATSNPDGSITIHNPADATGDWSITLQVGDRLSGDSVIPKSAWDANYLKMPSLQ